MVVRGAMPQDYRREHSGTAEKGAESQSNTTRNAPSRRLGNAGWLGTGMGSKVQRIVQYYQTNEAGQQLSGRVPYREATTAYPGAVRSL